VSAKRLVAALVAFAGATAFTACLLALVAGMRDVMVTDGGFCASGGPYVIAHQCSSSDIHLIMIGIFGALIAAGFYAGGSAGRREQDAGAPAETTDGPRRGALGARVRPRATRRRPIPAPVPRQAARRR